MTASANPSRQRQRPNSRRTAVNAVPMRLAKVIHHTPATQAKQLRDSVAAAPKHMSGTNRPTVTTVLRRFVHRVLTHPVTMAAKAPVKDALWTIRGRQFRNPQFGREVRSVLFLCHGNICRSPFAAVRAAQLLERAGIDDVHCASAGIAANQANQCPLEACAAAEVFGVNLNEHAPTILTAPMMDDFDLVVVVEAAQMQLLRERYPHAASRIVLLSLLEADRRGYARYNIADPFGQPRAAFDDCYQRIDRALQSLVELLSSNGSQSTGNSPVAAR